MAEIKKLLLIHLELEVDIAKIDLELHKLKMRKTK